MNPDRLEQLEKRVIELESGMNIQAVNSFMQVIVKDTPDVTDADVAVTISDTVGAEGGTVQFDVLDFPDRWLVIRYNGELFRVPAYLQRLDSSR